MLNSQMKHTETGKKILLNQLPCSDFITTAVPFEIMSTNECRLKHHTGINLAVHLQLDLSIYV